jgi:DNA-directed RNA polymerase I, II, and III subunit RPABC3
MSDSQLYEDTFLITSVNHQKYDRVARIAANSTDSSTALTLDINTELYPLNPGETISLVLASTLSLTGSGEEGGDARGWRELSRSGEATLADAYDYVMRGKVYRFEEGGESEQVKVFVSFGGLLMLLQGPWKRLAGVRMEYVFLCVKK